jgi:hypothetical protein
MQIQKSPPVPSGPPVDPSPAMKSADQSLLEPSRQRAISAGVNT